MDRGASLDAADSHDTDAVSLFRGSCDVLEHALLAQACRVILAAYVLASRRTPTQGATREAPLSSRTVTAHLWRSADSTAVDSSECVGLHQSHAIPGTVQTASTNTLSRVDHVREALAVAPGDLSVQRAVPRSFHEDDRTSTEAAVGCLHESPQCALLTALHMLLCPAHPFLHCRHGDGALVEAVRTRLCGAQAVHSSISSELTPPAKQTVARLLAEYVLSRGHEVSSSSSLDSEIARCPTSALALVDLATRLENDHTAPSVSRTQAKATGQAVARTLRVHTPDAIELVFPELTRAVGTTSCIHVHCDCPHVWFRQWLPRWLLQASQEAHAVTICEAHYLANAFRQWRRRRGCRLIEQLARDVEEDAMALAPPSLFSNPTPNAVPSHPPPRRSQCSSISGRSSTSVPSLPSQRQVLAPTRPAPVGNETADGGGETTPVTGREGEALGTTSFTAAAPATPTLSPTHRSGTRSPLRRDLVDWCSEDDAHTSVADSHPRTPSRAETTLQAAAAAADGLVASPSVAVSVGESSRTAIAILASSTSEADEVEAACFRRTQLLREGFLHWRDVRFYERLAARYIGKRADTLGRRTSWTTWRHRFLDRTRQRRHRHDELRCEVYVAQRAVPLLRAALQSWHTATQARHFAWQHVGRRAFAIWIRAMKGRQLACAKEVNFVQVEAPALVAESFHVWRSVWRQRVADRHRQARLRDTAWRRLRTQLDQSPSSRRLQVYRTAQAQRALQARFQQWRQKVQDRQLAHRYAHVHRLRLYRRVVMHWQAETRARQQRHAAEVAAAPRLLCACLQQWQARARERLDSRELHTTHTQQRCQRLFAHWRQRTQWRQKRRDDAVEVAERLAPSVQARAVLRFWFARMSRARAEKERSAMSRMHRTADDHRRLHVVARAFFRWRAKSFLGQHCGMDVRRALPLAAVLPSTAQRPEPLVRVSPNVGGSAGRERRATREATRKSKTRVPTTTDAEKTSDALRAARPPAPEAYARRLVVGGLKAALAAEQRFLAMGQSRGLRARESPALDVHCAASRAARGQTVWGDPPQTSDEAHVESARTHGSPSSASASSPGARVAMSAAPEGLNESRVSPRRSWASLPGRPKKLSIGEHIPGKASLTSLSRPHYMQPTVSSSHSSPTLVVTPEKQLLHRGLHETAFTRSGAFTSEALEEGMPTPIAADSQLMSSMASEGLSAW